MKRFDLGACTHFPLDEGGSLGRGERLGARELREREVKEPVLVRLQRLLLHDLVYLHAHQPCHLNEVNQPRKQQGANEHKPKMRQKAAKEHQTKAGPETDRSTDSEKTHTQQTEQRQAAMRQVNKTTYGQKPYGVTKKSRKIVSATHPRQRKIPTA